MIDALVSGRLFGAPVSRTSKAGRPFATGKLRVAIATGESVFVSVVAFSAHVVEGLLALSDGDSVALAGELRATAFVDREGTARPSLDLVAHQVLTAYHVGRKRKSVQVVDSVPPYEEAPPMDAPVSATPSGANEEFSDQIPF